uniref:Uncharacterized protein n=1 Tax=Oryza brachyantha TaxID=4533 RepID=J3LWU1_ORYBR
MSESASLPRTLHQNWLPKSSRPSCKQNSLPVITESQDTDKCQCHISAKLTIQPSNDPSLHICLFQLLLFNFNLSFLSMLS